MRKKSALLLVTSVVLTLTSTAVFAHANVDPLAGAFQNIIAAIVEFFS